MAVAKRILVGNVTLEDFTVIESVTPEDRRIIVRANATYNGDELVFSVSPTEASKLSELLRQIV